MLIITQELYHSMGLNVPSPLRGLQDQGEGMASPHPVSDSMSEMHIGDGMGDSTMAGDVPYDL
jgi:hypothetical protein